jgi:deoxycytidine triphosphate deaminase
MVLNGDQIRSRGLIIDGMKDKSIRDCGYDLTISTLLGKNDQGKIEDNAEEFDLDPQGIALAVSNETLKLPWDVCAHAIVKTTLCREGVLAINIGVIDPGWEGPVSSILLNFGRSTYRLKKDEAFLRLTFHTLDAPAHPTESSGTPDIAKIRLDYVNKVRTKFDKRLAGTFMDYQSLSWVAARKFFLPLAPVASMIGVALALLTLFMNWGVLGLASRSMPQDVVQTKAQVLTAEIKKDNESLHEENRKLLEQLEAMQAQLDKLSKKKP